MSVGVPLLPALLLGLAALGGVAPAAEVREVAIVGTAFRITLGDGRVLEGDGVGAWIGLA